MAARLFAIIAVTSTRPHMTTTTTKVITQRSSPTSTLRSTTNVKTRNSDLSGKVLVTHLQHTTQLATKLLSLAFVSHWINLTMTRRGTVPRQKNCPLRGRLQGQTYYLSLYTLLEWSYSTRTTMKQVFSTSLHAFWRYCHHH